jgi:serine/threonine-protein kinase HipA
MPPKSSGLDVFIGNSLVGRLWLDDGGKFIFQYIDSWVQEKGSYPLSVSLPLKLEPFENNAPRSFFSNLLPEAEIKEAISKNLGISRGNDYDLLKAIGGECAGAVSVLPSGKLPEEKSGYRELDKNLLHKTILELPGKPFLAGDRGIRLSLAGAQNKLPVYIESDRIFIPTGNSPSSHIIKPAIQRLTETVENEAFCMMLASSMGLNTPEVNIHQGIDRLFIVQRYDRETEGDHIVRLHQEDFCQALSVLPDRKYEAEGGPSLPLCFSLIKRISIRPAADQKRLLSWVIFNLLIGNMDAHAKNLSILYSKKGPVLAPFYDLISTTVYPDLYAKLAMKIGGENRPAWIGRRHLERLGEETGIKPQMIIKASMDISMSINNFSKALSIPFGETYGESAIVKRVIALIEKNALKLQRILS